MKNVIGSSAIIEASELKIRKSFRLYDAKSHAVRALVETPQENASVGELLIQAAQNDPRKIKSQQADLDRQMLAEIDAAEKLIEEQQKFGQDLLQAAKYLKNQGEPPTDAALFQHCEAVKAAALASSNVDPFAVGSDLERVIKPSIDELARFKSVFFPKTRLASTVTMRGKSFLLTQALGENSIIAETKLKIARDRYADKYGRDTKRGAR